MITFFKGCGLLLRRMRVDVDRAGAGRMQVSRSRTGQSDNETISGGGDRSSDGLAPDSVVPAGRAVRAGLTEALGYSREVPAGLAEPDGFGGVSEALAESGSGTATYSSIPATLRFSPVTS
jgi:hypothetical protein